MPTNRDVADFFELRHGFQGMVDFADAALRFLDRHGIAVRVPARRVNGNGNGHHLAPGGDLLRERVKRHYTKRRPSTSQAATPVAPTTPAMAPSQKIRQQRMFSAQVLEQLDATEPRALPKEAMRVIGALVRRGYVKKQGKGLYVRTKKAFAPATTGSAHDAAAAPAGDGRLITVAEAAKIIGVTDSAVRLYIKKGDLPAQTEARVIRAGYPPRDLMVLDRDAVTKYRESMSA